MSSVLTMERKHYESKKIVSISSKRQITIPQKFFTMLNFDKEAECFVKDGALVIKPAERIVDGGEFAEQILTDLIKQGLSGEELLAAFKKEQAKVRPAVEKILTEARMVAEDRAEYGTYDDVFGEEE